MGLDLPLIAILICSGRNFTACYWHIQPTWTSTVYRMVLVSLFVHAVSIAHLALLFYYAYSTTSCRSSFIHLVVFLSVHLSCTSRDSAVGAIAENQSSNHCGLGAVDK